jgi:hypothetical protein
MVVVKDAIGKCCNEFFEGKSNDLVVQVQFISAVRTSRLEGDSSGAYLKKSCSIWDAFMG